MSKDSVTTHNLKIWPSFFEAIVDGSKTFELRHDDRDYKVGDILLLKEWTDVRKFTGRELKRVVTYVLRNHRLLADDAVALGLKDVP